ncbi:hypothetical protein ODQ17_16910 [Acinetobacter sp. IRS14]|uniref:hypothetical protein n=1 Tax=Acinetobacter sp. IRS14 TaxID=2983398 RepID=UPI002AFDE703|nr:hypothetical protein [Acinetobacter sp. IRS14]MEA1231056.1 hypothetical protein [Acinetobacter sp. IRS14]
MTDLNKERELYESVIEKTQDIKMVHLVGISFNEEKNQYEVPDEKWASELTDACLELNTGWFIWHECVKAKAQAVPDQTINEIQSWIAVQSRQAMELDGEEFVVGANELAEFIEQLVKSESGAEG